MEQLLQSHIVSQMHFITKSLSSSFPPWGLIQNGLLKVVTYLISLFLLSHSLTRPAASELSKWFFKIIWNGKFVQKLPIFYEGDLYKFSIPHKLFYFNFKSFATKIEHVASLGFAAICMHKFTLLEEKIKEMCQSQKNLIHSESIKFKVL